MLNLKLDGSNATITNNQLKIVITKDAIVKNLKLYNKELLSNLTGEPGDPDKDHSFYLDYHMNSKTVNMHVTQMRVIQNDSNMIHLVYIDDKSQLGLKYHFIVRGDDNAIYGYVEAWNNSDETFEINELRTVYRLNHKLFNIGYNSERIGHQPASAHMMKGKKLQDETYLMEDGSFYSNSNIYSKYDYSGYTSENPFWGQYGNNYGLWFIPTDRSYFPSGPLNQDLLLHYDGLILNYLTGKHFGTGDMKIEPDWHKFYGPWCVLVTTGDGNSQIKEAKERVAKEQAAWPYSWVKDDNYPLNLGQVSGSLTYANAKPKEHFEVVLAQPSKDGTFMHQQTDYIYSSETDDEGIFTIDNIRPANYTLYAYALSGRLVGMFHWDKISVKESNNDIGNFDIADDHRKLVWQIGQSTHTTDGFKFSNQLRNHIWKDLVPNNLTYHIGSKSDDWYYLQNDGGTWTIVFDGKDIDKSKDAILTLAFAGLTKKVMTDPRGTKVKISLNGQEQDSQYYSENDSAGYRSALRGGNYELLTLNIPGAKINPGTNEISINTDGYLLYDTIKLEQEGE